MNNTTHHSHEDYRLHTLWLGVIKQAVADARAPIKTLADRVRKEELIEWSKDTDDFIWICKAAGQDTEEIRDLILSGIKETTN